MAHACVTLRPYLRLCLCFQEGEAPSAFSGFGGFGSGASATSAFGSAKPAFGAGASASAGAGLFDFLKKPAAETTTDNGKVGVNDVSPCTVIVLYLYVYESTDN